jgi:hypothetical protein
MEVVRASTNASVSQMSTLTAQVLQMSNITSQSALTTAQEMATATKAGLGPYGRIHTLFPELARFADVQQYLSRGTGQELSAPQAVLYGAQLSHLFQSYSVPAMHQMLEGITNVMRVTAEPLSKLVTQGKYFVPIWRQLVDKGGTMTNEQMNDVMAIFASMGQTGLLRNRGGTGIENTLFGAINATMLTGHLQGARAKALVDLGILDPRTGRNRLITAQGTLDINKEERTLSAAANRLTPAQYMADLQAAMGKQATQFLTVFTSPQVQAQLQTIKRIMAGLGPDPIGTLFKRFSGTLWFSWQLFQTNLQNLGIVMFKPLLPALTNFFTGAANAIGVFTDFLSKHPDIAKGIAIAGVALTGLFGLFAVGGAGMLMVTALGSAGPIMLAVAGGAAALAVNIAVFWKSIDQAREVIPKAWKALTTGWHELALEFQDSWKSLHDEYFKYMDPVWNALGNAFDWIGKKLGPIYDFIQKHPAVAPFGVPGSAYSSQSTGVFGANRGTGGNSGDTFGPHPHHWYKPRSTYEPKKPATPPHKVSIFTGTPEKPGKKIAEIDGHLLWHDFRTGGSLIRTSANSAVGGLGIG